MPVIGTQGRRGTDVEATCGSLTGRDRGSTLVTRCGRARMDSVYEARGLRRIPVYPLHPQAWVADAGEVEP